MNTLLLTASIVLAGLPDDARVTHNIRYGTLFNQAATEISLYCDIYQPAAADAPVSGKSPVVIFGHGGGWNNPVDVFGVGPAVAATLQPAGYTVVLIDMPVVSHDADSDGTYITKMGTAYGAATDADEERAAVAGIEAFKAAIRFVRKNGPALSLDLDKVYIMGWSSGAINAAHTAYCPETDLVDHNNPSYEHEVDGVALWSGSAALARNEGWITGASPATFIWHGDDDEHVLTDYDVYITGLISDLDTASVPLEDHVIVNGTHSSIFEDTNPAGDDVYDAYLAYLDGL